MFASYVIMMIFAEAAGYLGIGNFESIDSSEGNVFGEKYRL